MKSFNRDTSFSFISLAASALLSFYPFAAHADYTMITSGVITSGTDGAGLFGPSGTSLSGKAYQLAITYSDFTQAFNNVTPTLEKRAGSIPGKVSVTINGITSTMMVPTSYGAMIFANNNGAGYSALVGFQSGTDSNGNSIYATHDLINAAGSITGPRLQEISYNASSGDQGTVKFTSTTPISPTSPSGVLRVGFIGIPQSVQTVGALPIKGDINGDGAFDCLDLRAAQSGIGKNVKQPGFVPGADVDGNLVIDVRDIAAISRLLPIGTHCN